MIAAIENTLMGVLCAIAQDAGSVIMAIRKRGFEVEAKQDNSPVTEADRQAEKVIVEALASKVSGVLLDDYPVIAEESAEADRLPDSVDGPFWLVDPLDGTKSFVRGSKEFTVNIALISDRAPVLGIICAPALNASYWGGPSLGAFADLGQGPQPIAARPPPREGYHVLGSVSHAVEADRQFLARLKVAEMGSVGSSLKFCLLARGEADVYPRHGQTMEWDSAAGQAILEAAGGRVSTPDGRPLAYGKPRFANDGGFIAWGKPDTET